MKSKTFKTVGILLTALLITVLAAGCSSDRQKNAAKEAAARYWQDKAYPGQAYDVQVIDAEKVDGGYRVKGIVDGETRVGLWSPDSDTFDEGYYSLAKERDKEIAELQEQVKYWKEKSQDDDKTIYKLKVRLSLATGQKLTSDSEDEDEAVQAQQQNQQNPSVKPVSAPLPTAAPTPAPPQPTSK